MPQGLRQHKRLQAMRHVQSIALDLFEADGYDAVTIADIADRAEVAERSVYRYFGTKEGILLWNEADVDFFGAVAELLRDHSLGEALTLAIADVDSAFTPQLRAQSSRLVALLRTVPSARAFAVAEVAAAGEQLAAALAAARGLPQDDLECLVQASAAVTALALALQRWESSPDDEPLSRVLGNAIDALTRWGR